MPKIKDILNALVEKKKDNHHNMGCGCPACYATAVNNHTIDQQGLVEIGLNRERLISILKELLLTPKKLEQKPTIAELEKLLNSESVNSWLMDENGEILEMRPKYSIKSLADAIIAAESTLLEVKK